MIGLGFEPSGVWSQADGFLPLCRTCFPLQSLFFPLWATGHCYSSVWLACWKMPFLYRAAGFLPCVYSAASSLTSIANRSWEHQNRMPGTGQGLETHRPPTSGADAGQKLLGEITVRGPHSSRKAKIQELGKFLELLG